MDKREKVQEAAIKQAIKELDKIIDKTYKKIEKTGYPLNPFSIADMVTKGWWSSKE